MATRKKPLDLEKHLRRWRRKLRLRLRAIRKQRGFTQIDAANLADLHQADVSRFERGATPNPGIDTVLRLALVYEVKLEELFMDVHDLDEEE